MSAVNDKGQPVTTVGGWTATLVTSGEHLSISFTKPGSALINISVDVLKNFPANLDDLAKLSPPLETLVGLEAQEVNTIFDWVRSNIDLNYV